jgi:hypothetical protein
LIHKVETVYDKEGKKKRVKLEEKDWIRIDTKLRLFKKAYIEKVREARSLHPSTRKKRTRANEAKYPPGYKLLQGLLYCECGRVMSPFSSGFYYRCKRKGCRSDGLKMKETDRLVWKTFEDDLTDPGVVYDALKAENLIPSGDLKEARKRIKVGEAKLAEISDGKDRLVEQFTFHRISKNKYEDLMVKLEKDETRWKNERAKAENTSYESDFLGLTAESAAKYMRDKIEVLKALKAVKASLVDADTLTKLEYYPKLNEIMKDLCLELEAHEIPHGLKLEDAKNVTFELKRNILKDANKEGIKLVAYKDGSIVVDGFLTSEFSVQATFG